MTRIMTQPTLASQRRQGFALAELSDLIRKAKAVALAVRGKGLRCACWLIGLTLIGLPLRSALAEIDRNLYMPVDEIQPGMKGFGRTVVSGTAIDTFEVEIISVMRNAFYAKKDVILARLSGLNLEHSGVVAGMSGSPCYIKDKNGKPRMIGAVAYGWMFSKDPICGIQPIEQMFNVAANRRPDRVTTEGPMPAAASANRAGGTSVPLTQWIRHAIGEPIDPAWRFSVLAEPDETSPTESQPLSQPSDTTMLAPLGIPVMVSGLAPEVMDLSRRWFDRHQLIPVAAGGATHAARAQAGDVQLEPGSAICVPLITGDLAMEGLGTCTPVIGDEVLGFGHSMFGQGRIDLPMATGFVHTVLPSIARSTKMGGALKTVGTLYGDESSAIFGLIGQSPKMVPLDVVVNDHRGQQSYHYEVVQEENITPSLLATALLQSLFSDNEPPREHSVRYTIEVTFDQLGTFRTENFTSQGGLGPVALDLIDPVSTLMNPPLAQRAKVASARIEVTIEEGARAATINQVTIPKTVYKPGETIRARVRWFHERRAPTYTTEHYSLTLPDDLPDGDYKLTLGSAKTHVKALKKERPYLFRVETLGEALEALNLLGTLADDRLYMRLTLPTGGMTYKRTEMPELPSFRKKILIDSKLSSDLGVFTDALVVQHKTDSTVSGSQTLAIKVSRRADQ